MGGPNNSRSWKRRDPNEQGNGTHLHLYFRPEKQVISSYTLYCLLFKVKVKKIKHLGYLFIRFVTKIKTQNQVKPGIGSNWTFGASIATAL